MSRRPALALTLLVATLVLGAAPLLAAPAGARNTDKVLRIDQGLFPVNPLDPHKTSWLDQIAVVGLDYEGLTRLDEESQTVPGAAESWEFSDDGTVLTFALRDGLTYADGSPLTADRFVYAVERTCDPRTEALYASILFAVVGCEAFFGLDPATADEAAFAAARGDLGVRALDDRTLEVRLTTPAAYFPTVASTWVFYPVQREAVEADPDGWWRDPATRIGNGPFRVTSLDDEEPDQRIVFAANERYWGGRPKLDAIEYVYFPEGEDQAGFDAYQAGEVDIAGFPSRLLATVEGDPVLSQEVVRYPVAGTVQLAFNHTQEPFTDQQVRAAFALAFDRAAYCRDVLQGICAPTLSWIPPGVPGHIESDDYAFDPEQARQALAASSYGGSENLPEITYPYFGDYPIDQQIAEWLVAQYREVLGVELTLEPLDAESYYARFVGDPTLTPQLAFGGWTQDYPDPQNWLSIYWTCDATNHAVGVGYCNPAFDALIARADAELDPAERLALYEEAQRLLVADAPAVFVLNNVTAVLVKPHVVDYVTTPRDLWPGWASVLTIDLAPASSATPVA